VYCYKQIFSLLSIVAIASCGTMPIPDNGEGNGNKSIETVDAASVNHDESGSDKSAVEPVSPQVVETNQKNAMPDTSYLADVTDSKDIKGSKIENSSRAIDVNDNSIVISNEPENLDYIVTDNGLIKKVPASTQTEKNTKSAKNTTILNQKPDPNKTNSITAKADSNQDQELRIQLALANRYYNSAKYENAIDLLETPTLSSKSNDRMHDLLLLSYTKYAKELVSKANLLEAQTVLEKAVSIEPHNTSLQNQLKKIKNTREANRIYQLGLEAANSGDKISAFKAFQKVLVLNPSHSMAKQQVAKIRTPVIESRYKEAMQYYRKQELTEAIRAWDDVLGMDPSHELAKLYRFRAVELKQKIDIIDEQ